MKQVGSRREAPLSIKPSGELLARGARFSQEMAALAPSTFFPKGIFRYRTHEEANQHQEESLALGMAELAAQRGSG